MTREKVRSIKADFDKVMVEFAKKHNLNISNGGITFNLEEMRFKIVMQDKSENAPKTKYDRGEENNIKFPDFEKGNGVVTFKVGDMVRINHKKVNPNDVFEVIKVNRTKVKVSNQNSYTVYNVEPSLLVKI